MIRRSLDIGWGRIDPSYANGEAGLTLGCNIDGTNVLFEGIDFPNRVIGFSVRG